jgi:alpha-galactosidase
VVQTDGTHLVFARPLANGDAAVALFNEGDTAATMSTTASKAGLGQAPAYVLKDLWSKKQTETAGAITAAVPAHGTVIYRVSTSHDWANVAPATAAAVSAAPAYPGGPVVTAPGEGTTVTTTLSNTGRTPITDGRVSLAGPSGWSVAAQGATGTPQLGTDRTFTTQWTVTPPANAAPGTYTLAVTARYLWDDGTRSDSTTGELQVLVPNPPPTSDAYVSDLPWTSFTNGWGPPERDRSNGETGASDGHTITIAGQTYAKGIGAHAPGEIDVYVGGHCSAFTADVGVDDEVGVRGSVDFQVFADGTKVADSGTVTGADSAKPLNATLTGARFLRLVLTDAGDGNSYDHSDWANAHVTCA